MLIKQIYLAPILHQVFAHYALVTVYPVLKEILMILQDHEDYATRHRLIQELLTEHGRTLVTNLIHASVFCLHSYMLCDVANVIIELLTWDREVSVYKHLFGFDSVKAKNTKKNP